MGETRFPIKGAMIVAMEIVELLRASCVRIEIAGSLRRQKPDVGDIEILYIPKDSIDPMSLFFEKLGNQADVLIRKMEAGGILERRRNVKGSEMFGEKNKLMRHVASGIPVDLFAATEENWFNYLVCRTGPAALNQRICMEAQRIGWKWNPYGVGFTAADNGQVARMESEEDVFNFVGLPYAEPERRV